MAVNPNGFVQANDFGNPRIMTGEAMEIISGGQYVGASGTTGVVTSGLSTYVNSDVKFYICDDPENVVGIATQTVASGAALGAAVDALILSACIGSVFAGRLVKCTDATGVENLGSTVVPADAEDASIAGNAAGRAYTAGASGGFALIHFKP